MGQETASEVETVEQVESEDETEPEVDRGGIPVFCQETLREQGDSTARVEQEETVEQYVLLGGLTDSSHHVLLQGLERVRDTTLGSEREQGLLVTNHYYISHF